MCVGEVRNSDGKTQLLVNSNCRQGDFSGRRCWREGLTLQPWSLSERGKKGGAQPGLTEGQEVGKSSARVFDIRLMKQIT